MRISCPHCQHRGFTALAKLKANPAWPAHCKYCKYTSHPETLLSLGACGLTLGLLVAAGAAGLGEWPWWTVGLVAALLAGCVHQLLRRPGVIVTSAVMQRNRVKVIVLGALILTAALGLLAVAQMSGSAPSANTTAAT